MPVKFATVSELIDYDADCAAPLIARFLYPIAAVRERVLRAVTSLWAYGRVCQRLWPGQPRPVAAPWSTPQKWRLMARGIICDRCSLTTRVT